MLVEGEQSPQNDFDSFRGHLLIGSNFFSLLKLLIWDLVAFYMVYKLIGSNFFSLLKLLIWDLIAFYVGSRITKIAPCLIQNSINFKFFFSYRNTCHNFRTEGFQIPIKPSQFENLDLLGNPVVAL